MRERSKYMLAFEVPMSMRDEFDALVAKHRLSRQIPLRESELAIGAQVVAAGVSALTRR